MAAEPYQVSVIGHLPSAKISQVPCILASPYFELGAIVQRHGDLATTDEAKCLVHRFVEALFVDASIDAVVVSTPLITHIDLVSGALAAEKPRKTSKAHREWETVLSISSMRRVDCRQRTF